MRVHMHTHTHIQIYSLVYFCPSGLELLALLTEDNVCQPIYYLHYSPKQRTKVTQAISRNSRIAAMYSREHHELLSLETKNPNCILIFLLYFNFFCHGFVQFVY